MRNNYQKWQGEGPEPSFWSGMRNRWGCLLWFVLIAALFFLLPTLLNGIFGANPAQSISYTEFRKQVEAGNVKEVLITGQQVKGTLKNSIEQNIPPNQTIKINEFNTYLPPVDNQDLLPMLNNNGVVVRSQPQSDLSFGTIILYLLPVALIIGFSYMLFRNMRTQGGGSLGDIMSMTRSRAKQYERTNERTTFGDVAGSEGAKMELEEIIQFLKDPRRFQRLGAQIPKGVLLVGPPGTGKTLLARAVAGEAGVPFYSISGSDFMEMFVGVGASRVRDLFKNAKENSPAIIFIDELDSIGRKRGAGLGGGHDEREQTLNQMLSEMDGFEPNENVIVMAATNRPDILDPAILRPGRFDREITVDLPTMQERLEILKIHARNKPLADDVNLETIARSTPGFSGADLANLLNEAALLAARREADKISQTHIDDARDKVIMGLERNMQLTDEELRLVAYHEAGHAVVGAILPHADPVHKVTIVPRGRAMGVTQQFPERDQYLYPRDYMLDRMAVMMGGRAAEEIAMDTMTSGAANDFKQATNLARKMVLEWGMSKRMGPVSLSDENQAVFLGDEITRSQHFSDITAREADEEIRSVLEEAYERAKQTLQENRAALDQVVKRLLETEQMSGAELLAILGKNPKGKLEKEEVPAKVRPAIDPTA